MNIQTQLCTFKTADNERLHGLLFTPPSDDSDMALVFIHGVAMNFYLPPQRSVLLPVNLAGNVPDS
jgi:hypothetical protein